MSYTDQDVREGRRLMDDGRENRLVIGDKLLSVTASGQDSAFDQYCDEISLNPRTARQYRHTARMCTPPVRQLVADSGVHVSYSALREGACLALSGKPNNEGYSTLRTLLEEAREAGAGRISVPQYRRALGMGPALQDLLDPTSDMSVAEYLGALPPAERDKVLRDLVEEDAKVHDAIKRAMDEKRSRDRENPGPECPAASLTRPRPWRGTWYGWVNRPPPVAPLPRTRQRTGRARRHPARQAPGRPVGRIHPDTQGRRGQRSDQCPGEGPQVARGRDRPRRQPVLPPRGPLVRDRRPVPGGHSP